MTIWKYTDATNSVVFRVTDTGITESKSVYAPDIQEWLDEGNTPQPADPLPNPRIAEIQSRLAKIDIESVRALRAKSVGKGKPADDTKLNALETEAEALRAELATL